MDLQWLNLFKGSIPTWIVILGFIYTNFSFSGNFDKLENRFAMFEKRLDNIESNVKELTIAFYEQKTSTEVLKTEMSHLKTYPRCQKDET